MDTDYLDSLSPEELERKKGEAREAMAIEGPRRTVVSPEIKLQTKEVPQEEPVIPSPEIKKIEGVSLAEDLVKEALARSKPKHLTNEEFNPAENEMPPASDYPRASNEKFEVLNEEQQTSSHSDLEDATDLAPSVAMPTPPQATWKREEKIIVDKGPHSNISSLLNPTGDMSGSRNAVFDWTEEENDKLSHSRGRRLFVLLGAITLVLLGIGVGAFTFLRNKGDTVLTLPTVRFENILTPDSEITVLLEDKTKSLSLLVEASKTGELKSGEIRRVVPLLALDKNKTEMQTGQFFEYTNIAIPENITRSAAKQFVYGQYKDENQITFIVMKIEKGEVSYQNAFIGMGSWEKNMPSDLTEILDIKKIAERPVWENSSIQNTPVRIFGEESDPTLIWGFINKETVLITTNAKAFGAITERLTKSYTPTQ